MSEDGDRIPDACDFGTKGCNGPCEALGHPDNWPDIYNSDTDVVRFSFCTECVEKAEGMSFPGEMTFNDRVRMIASKGADVFSPDTGRTIEPEEEDDEGVVFGTSLDAQQFSSSRR